jgi:hypothetical protein
MDYFFQATPCGVSGTAAGSNAGPWPAIGAMYIGYPCGSGGNGTGGAPGDIVAVSNAAFTALDIATFASNAALGLDSWPSNLPAPYLNGLAATSNQAFQTSQLVSSVVLPKAEWGSNAARFASNVAVAASNTAVVTSNALSSVQAQAAFGSNAVAPLQAQAAFGSNALPGLQAQAAFASNAVQPLQAQAAFGSNLVGSTAFASNAVQPLQAQAAFGSNAANTALLAAVHASNQTQEVFVFLTNSNAAFSNAAGGAWASNQIPLLTPLTTYQTWSNAVSSNISGLASGLAATTSGLGALDDEHSALLDALDLEFDAVSSKAAFGSNAAAYGCNLALSVLDATSVVGEAASWASNAIVPLQSQAAFGSNTALDALDAVSVVGEAASWASNAIVPLQSQAAFGSNAAAYGCNLALDALDTVSIIGEAASWASNAIPPLQLQAAFGSNAAAYGCNVALDALDAVSVIGEAASFGSNQAVAASIVAQWSSNVVTATSNAVTLLQSQAAFGSNQAVSGTASALWASNAITPLQSQAAFGSNTALDALDAVSVVGEAASWASNAIVPLQSQAAFGSNAAAFGSNTALDALDLASVVGEAASFGSNQAVTAASTASWASNALPALATNAKVAAVSNIAVAASNQAFAGGGGVGGGGSATVSVPWWASNVSDAIAVDDTQVDDGGYVQRTRRVRAGGYLDERVGSHCNLVLYPPSNSQLSAVQVRNAGLDRVTAEFRSDGTTTLSNAIITGALTMTMGAPYPSLAAARVTVTPATPQQWVTFSNLTSPAYQLNFTNWATTTGVTQVQLSSNNGATWFTSGYDATSMITTWSSAGWGRIGYTGGFCMSSFDQTSSNHRISGMVTVQGTARPAAVTVTGNSVLNRSAAGDMFINVVVGRHNAASNVNALRLGWSTGSNTLAGDFSLYAL